MTKRDAKGRFAAGQSGNPSGRPAKSDELRRLLEGEADAVARKVLEAAANGDMGAARLVLERCVPTQRPIYPPVAFDFDADAPLTDQARQILAAVAGGHLPADQGKALIDGIAGLVKVTEQDEIVRRIAEIENRVNDK
jgi:hypothetical protein